MLTAEIALSKISNYPLLTSSVFLASLLPSMDTNSLLIFILFHFVVPFIPALYILWTLLFHHVLGWVVLFPISSFWEFCRLLHCFPCSLCTFYHWMAKSSSTTCAEESESSLSPQNGLLILNKSPYLSSFDFVKCNIPENS